MGKPNAANSSSDKPNATPAPAPTPKGRPTQEEIDAIRRERAAKKQREQEEREKNASLGIIDLGKNGGKLPFTPRQWAKVKGRKTSTNTRTSLRILSWNILAQGLVRRKLFPGSDCLRWKDRQDCLLAEMAYHDWDVATFQEVDRIETHAQNLNKMKRKYIYAKGYTDKQHGLMIAWRTTPSPDDKDRQASAFEDEAAASKVIFFDRENVDAHKGQIGERLALSRVTRNIALFAALKYRQPPQGGRAAGVIVATTHLFWHPMHAYERVRQMGIMKRRLVQWRDEHVEWSHWPILLSGDFNDQPYSATYKLVTGEQLTQHCLDEVQRSTVVHRSVDELREKIKQDDQHDTVQEAIVANGDAAQKEASGPGNEGEAPSGESAEIAETVENVDGEEDQQEEDEDDEDDQVLKNCRLANEEDLLMTFDELIMLHDLSSDPPTLNPTNTPKSRDDLLQQRPKKALISLYGTHFNNLEPTQEGNYFGSTGRWRERHDDADWTPDQNPNVGSSVEPMYTLYSALFSLTLDYIFLFPGKDDHDGDGAATSQPQPPIVTALLPTHRTDILKPGVPRRGVCASDHIAIGAELLL